MAVFYCVSVYTCLQLFTNPVVQLSYAIINGLNCDCVEGEATNSTTSLSFCASHPVQPVVTYCRDCEKALCERCRSVGGPDTAGTCPHSSCCELSAAAHTGRAQLEEDEQVVARPIQLTVVLRGTVDLNKGSTYFCLYFICT